MGEGSRSSIDEEEEEREKEREKRNGVLIVCG
jgi:hypothetical protein